MRVLLVESTPGNATAVRQWLDDAGHDTTTCFDPPVGFGCRGVEHHEDCPLDQPVDVALLVRDLDAGTHSLTEMGAVCALRHRVPVVELTEPDASDLDDVMLGALAKGNDGGHAAYVAAVRRALEEVTSLRDPASVGVTVTRSSGRVHALLHVPADVADTVVPMIVDWTSRALRSHDPYVKVIDVGVSRAA